MDDLTIDIKVEEEPIVDEEIHQLNLLKLKMIKNLHPPSSEDIIDSFNPIKENKDA